MGNKNSKRSKNNKVDNKNSGTKNEQKKCEVDAEEQEDFPQNENPLSSDVLEQIRECGSIIAVGGHIIHCLTIIGQIEGHNVLPPQNKTTKYEHIIPQLVAIEENPDIEGVLVLLNTAGGDVEAGLAIAEVLAGMNKPTVSIVLGGGHSIGIPLAVAAKYSYIARSASMTVHPVRSNGLTLGVPQTFEYFRKMQERINTFVSSNSNIPCRRYNELAMNTQELVLDVGTILEGEEAVEEGLIDEVGTIRNALDHLYNMIDENKSCKNKKKQDKSQDKK